MTLDNSEHIGNVLIAAVLTILFGLLAASLMWCGVHFDARVAATSASVAGE